jgi:hypothetical protein
MPNFTVPTLRHCRGLHRNRADCTRTHEAQAIRALRKTGVTILDQRNNGRRIVVVVDTPPAFVRGAMCRRRQTPEGTTEYTLAAPWRGLQLEWNQQPKPEVCHG